jgi:hypothetical protein
VAIFSISTARNCRGDSQDLFHVTYGELIWGDFDLCFPVIDLYRNCIEHVDTMAQAA